MRNVSGGTEIDKYSNLMETRENIWIAVGGGRGMNIFLFSLWSAYLPIPLCLEMNFVMQSPTMKIRRYVGHSLSPWDLGPRALIMFDSSRHCGPLASSASREQTDTKILSQIFHQHQIQFIKTQVLPLSVKMLQTIFWRQVMSKLHDMFNWISKLISPSLYPLLFSFKRKKK